ncbi:flavin oxidoreductase [Cytophagaceae bacterium 50C-KIRBA]|uniref:Flavin oxidoreductase n=1 Tax=Aquirufa beregesia TaxID=2516556 RepID=A0ABX0EZR5_9BACT|nr:flavin reductase [Aquirufa beregesia]NGZ44766.1 flavin oxidoreductase [Aquirufa beregesia]
MIAHLADIESMEKSFRTNLINHLTGGKAVHLIGTYNEHHQSNLAIFSNVIHIGAYPAMIGVLFRPIGENSHTYKNIQANKQFTLNQIPLSMVQQAHQTSARYPFGTSEFEACEIEEETIPEFDGPFVKHSLIKMGLIWEEEHLIKSNQTVLLVGKIQYISIEDSILLPDGHIDLGLAQSLSAGGLDTYYQLNQLTQFPYAKVLADASHEPRRNS